MGAIEGALRASPATGAILYALDQLDSDIYEQTERTVFGATADIGEEIVALGNTLNDKLGIYEFDDELNDKQQEYNKQILSVLFGPDSVEMDSRGNRTVAKVKEPTYYGGETARDLTQLAIGLRFGTKAATSTTVSAALTDDIDLIPYIGIVKHTNTTARNLVVHYEKISRILFE